MTKEGKDITKEQRKKFNKKKKKEGRKRGREEESCQVLRHFSRDSRLWSKNQGNIFPSLKYGLPSHDSYSDHKTPFGK